MFGMLDYRAHKLYEVLVNPIAFVLTVFAIFGLPLISYLIAKHYVADNIERLLLAGVILLFIGIPWILVAKVILAIPVAVFNFLIDPVPTDGRSKEDAKVVVQSGQKGIALLELNRPANEWSDAAIETVSTKTLTCRMFQSAIRRRMYALQKHYIMRPELAQNDHNTKKFLKKNNLSMGLIETAITNPMWRNTILQYIVLLGIYIFNLP